MPGVIERALMGTAAPIVAPGAYPPASLASQFRATSAASSRALSTYLPSYQKRAEWTLPKAVTVEDQAVLPPVA